MIHPEKLKAIWICGEAPAPLPEENLFNTALNYPLGIKDIAELSGKPFNLDLYKQVPHFVCVGENDTNPENDTTTFTDIFNGAQALFIRSNFGETNPDRIQFYYDFLVTKGIAAEFKIYRGLGHEISDNMMLEAFRFLLSHE